MSKKAMYDLRNMLCDELDELARKGELGAGDLEIAHKLTDTIKNIDKIEMLEDDGYSRDGTIRAVIPVMATGSRVCAALMTGICPTRDAARIMCASTIPVTAASTI